MGECAPDPLQLYNTEYTKGAFAVACDVLALQIIGKDVSSPDQLQSIFSEFKGHEFDQSSFDSAWWDAYAHKSDKPL